MKQCSVCGNLKSITEFSKRSHRNTVHTSCKECRRKKSKQYGHKHKTVEGNDGEKLVKAELLKHGIYAAPGKCSEFKNQDLVAWGCVRIEVKTSQLHSRKQNSDSYQFDLGDDKTKFNRTDIVVLVCMDTISFHVFESNHPTFYHGGVLKKSVMYIPEPKHVKYPDRVLTKDMMENAQNKWEIIEEYRQKYIKELKKLV